MMNLKIRKAAADLTSPSIPLQDFSTELLVGFGRKPPTGMFGSDRIHEVRWGVVYGDVNSTVAAALVCSKLQVRVGHVEAGLRSRDRSMPEEINRIITDQLSDLLFAPSEDANQNLEREGVDSSKIHLVGNVMIDTLVRLQPCAVAHKPPGVT